uniref:Uncharacterized protein n=1 Tax=Heliothis virescens TaxID=7102 RepID=A0A2A4JX17_HELVI
MNIVIFYIVVLNKLYLANTAPYGFESDYEPLLLLGSVMQRSYVDDTKASSIAIRTKPTCGPVLFPEYSCEDPYTTTHQPVEESTPSKAAEGLLGYPVFKQHTTSFDIESTTWKPEEGLFIHPTARKLMKTFERDTTTWKSKLFAHPTKGKLMGSLFDFTLGDTEYEMESQDYQQTTQRPTDFVRGKPESQQNTFKNQHISQETQPRDVISLDMILHNMTERISVSGMSQYGMRGRMMSQGIKSPSISTQNVNSNSRMARYTPENVEFRSMLSQNLRAQDAPFPMRKESQAQDVFSLSKILDNMFQQTEVVTLLSSPAKVSQELLTQYVSAGFPTRSVILKDSNRMNLNNQIMKKTASRGLVERLKFHSTTTEILSGDISQSENTGINILQDEMIQTEKNLQIISTEKPTVNLRAKETNETLLSTESSLHAVSAQTTIAEAFGDDTNNNQATKMLPSQEESILKGIPLGKMVGNLSIPDLTVHDVNYYSTVAGDTGTETTSSLGEIFHSKSVVGPNFDMPPDVAIDTLPPHESANDKVSFRSVTDKAEDHEISQIKQTELLPEQIGMLKKIIFVGETMNKTMDIPRYETIDHFLTENINHQLNSLHVKNDTTSDKTQYIVKEEIPKQTPVPSEVSEKQLNNNNMPQLEVGGAVPQHAEVLKNVNLQSRPTIAWSGQTGGTKQNMKTTAVSPKRILVTESRPYDDKLQMVTADQLFGFMPHGLEFQDLVSGNTRNTLSRNEAFGNEMPSGHSDHDFSLI